MIKIKDTGQLEKFSITQLTYQYILTSKEKTVELDVDKVDIIENADGELDCPLETVLRKNNYTINNLSEWNINQIQFVEIDKGISKVLRTIDLNNNF